MKISTLCLAVAATICAGAFGASQARAIRLLTTTKTQKIVMHDPGCDGRPGDRRQLPQAHGPLTP
jgi:hypothetical protein